MWKSRKVFHITHKNGGSHSTLILEKNAIAILHYITYSEYCASMFFKVSSPKTVSKMDSCTSDSSSFDSFWIKWERNGMKEESRIKCIRNHPKD
jgi:hypothetical protein